MDPKKFAPEKNCGPKNFCPPKKFGVQNMRGPKKIVQYLRITKIKAPNNFKYKKIWSTQIKLPKKLVPKLFVKIWSVIAEILLILTNVTLKVHNC